MKSPQPVDFAGKAYFLTRCNIELLSAEVADMRWRCLSEASEHPGERSKMWDGSGLATDSQQMPTAEQRDPATGFADVDAAHIPRGAQLALLCNPEWTYGCLGLQQ